MGGREGHSDLSLDNSTSLGQLGRPVGGASSHVVLTKSLDLTQLQHFAYSEAREQRGTTHWSQLDVFQKS